MMYLMLTAQTPSGCLHTLHWEWRWQTLKQRTHGFKPHNDDTPVTNAHFQITQWRYSRHKRTLSNLTMTIRTPQTHTLLLPLHCESGDSSSEVPRAGFHLQKKRALYPYFSTYAALWSTLMLFVSLFWLSPLNLVFASLSGWLLPDLDCRLDAHYWVTDIVSLRQASMIRNPLQINFEMFWNPPDTPKHFWISHEKIPYEKISRREDITKRYSKRRTLSNGYWPDIH